METVLYEWLSLLLRWAHFAIGVAWIGTSFFFVWLDLSLKPNGRDGVKGESWMVHGGGFYHAQKYMVAPARLPEPLHWFKYEAYGTWITGMLLLFVIYYWQAEAFLLDPEKADIGVPAGIAISLVAILGGFAVYHALCKSPLRHRTGLLAFLVFLLIVFAAWALNLVFSGRAAFLHVGALVGTMMAANVFAVIIPNQRKTVDALIAGQDPDPALGAEAGTRSLHNNYLTLPVLAMMIGSHYPLLYDHPQSWLIVALLLVGSGAFKHFLNRLDQGARFAQAAWLLPATAAALVVAVILTAHRPEPADDVAEAVSDDDAFEIVEARCSVCHAPEPVWEGYLAAPAGVKLHTPEQLDRLEHAIEVQAVLSRAMPPGNLTGITPEERAALGRWLADQ